MFRKFLFLLLAAAFIATVPAQAATYKVDPDHTTVSFKIRHLFSKVEGRFTKFEGTIVYDPDKPDTWSSSGTIPVSSLDTGVEQRDKHLRSADFFDAEKYPTIEFKMTKVLGPAKERTKIEGLITIHGVEKPVVLDVEIHGVGKDPWGNIRAGFTAITTINRKDFGMNWNEPLGTGQLLLGEDVAIILEIEGIQQ